MITVSSFTLLVCLYLIFILAPVTLMWFSAERKVVQNKWQIRKKLQQNQGHF